MACLFKAVAFKYSHKKRAINIHYKGVFFPCGFNKIKNGHYLH